MLQSISPSARAASGVGVAVGSGVGVAVGVGVLGGVAVGVGSGVGVGGGAGVEVGVGVLGTCVGGGALVVSAAAMGGPAGAGADEESSHARPAKTATARTPAAAACFNALPKAVTAFPSLPPQPGVLLDASPNQAVEMKPGMRAGVQDRGSLKRLRRPPLR